jgi:hypothetical protein
VVWVRLEVEKLQVPRLRSPGFPVELVALMQSMRLSLRERRTRGSFWCCVTGNPGRDDKWGEMTASTYVTVTDFGG